ncbi:META domain-containing protein [Streptomyces sp. BR123]|uniref:META domain-containing protein n=1 Tax=Streptomyces sp. BR123 TaxID=2749828 RepID=UPI0015C494F8|nr:META domain-containing protein [Streptomyces sp. BR123]NXY96036.1 META domain-containing protein [Streptomyces sp. BR123]
MPTLRHLPAALAAALVLAAATTACADGSGPSGPLPGPGFTGSWSVQRVTADGRSLAGPPAAHLTIEPTGSRTAEAKGNYGCNGFTAAVSYESGSEQSAVTVTPGSSTAMACEHMDFETAFAELLKGRLEVRRESADRLVLTAADGGTIELTSKPPVADAPLTVTEWTVTGLISGGTAASVTNQAAGRAVFTIGPDARASGSLGCNRFSAPAAIDGPRITFGPLSTTRMACTGPEGDLERTLTELLGSGGLTWRIQERTLTLTAADGKGLTARAASAAE